MENNKIFEVEGAEEVEVLGKCPICGRVCTEQNEDKFREIPHRKVSVIQPDMI